MGVKCAKLLTLVLIYAGHVVRLWSPLGPPSFWRREQRRPGESPLGRPSMEAQLTAEHLGHLLLDRPAFLMLPVLATMSLPLWEHSDGPCASPARTLSLSMDALCPTWLRTTHQDHQSWMRQRGCQWKHPPLLHPP